MYTCEYMHVYKEALSVSARRGAQTYASSHNMVCVQTYLWYDTYICEHTDLYRKF